MKQQYTHHNMNEEIYYMLQINYGAKSMSPHIVRIADSYEGILLDSIENEHGITALFRFPDEDKLSSARFKLTSSVFMNRCKTIIRKNKE